jgi:hypothetical protein
MQGRLRAIFAPPVFEDDAEGPSLAGQSRQATGVEQIALAMQNINQATAQSLDSTRQTERAAQELSVLAGQLTQIVAVYEILEGNSNITRGDAGSEPNTSLEREHRAASSVGSAE